MSTLRCRQRHWYVNSNGYAATMINDHMVPLQVFLLGRPRRGYEIDHKNCNRLDNRRCNLRCLTRSLNVTNGLRRRNNTTGYRGVVYYKDRCKWAARHYHEGRLTFCQFFTSPEAASKAYEKHIAKMLRRL